MGHDEMMLVEGRNAGAAQPVADARLRSAERIETAIATADAEIEMLAAYRNKPGCSIAIHTVANTVANTFAQIVEYERLHGPCAESQEWRRRCDASIAAYLPLAISRK